MLEIKPIGDIKKMLSETNIKDIPEIIRDFENDERKGVKSLVSAFKKKYACYVSEIKRLEKISVFEKEGYEKGYSFICGVDEVGRGPFAGPVVAAAVILERDCNILGINDSKKLSNEKRIELDKIIKEKAVSIGIGIVDNNIIDDINILQATYKAMQKAIKAMSKIPDYILVDAVKIPEINITQNSIIKGDSKSISIGAASIVAKVYRDELMDKFSKIYPAYKFEKNKGYGTAEHIEAIKKYGLCDIHRKSFTKNFI